MMLLELMLDNPKFITCNNFEINFGLIDLSKYELDGPAAGFAQNVDRLVIDNKKFIIYLKNKQHVIVPELMGLQINHEAQWHLQSINEGKAHFTTQGFEIMGKPLGDLYVTKEKVDVDINGNLMTFPLINQ